MSQVAQFQQALLNWFDSHGRKDLPWQQNINHYRVWVSEIMLQQTQVKTAIPYFNHFMQRFPNLIDLAKAPIDEVMQYWSGLGYYARARNLHKAAQIIVKDFHGQFPSSHAEVSSLPGIGRSTASAILSIVEQQALAILDGNVKRVLSRVHAVAGYPGEKKVNDKLWQIAESYTPSQRVHHYTQAMMDLGATLCTRSKPNCDACPVQTHCQAYAKGEVTKYPGKKPAKAIAERESHFLILVDDELKVLLEKRPDKGIWGGLWTLPSFDNAADLGTWLHGQFQVKDYYHWPKRKHVFTHFTLHFTPVNAKLTHTATSSENHSWHNPQQVAKLGLPAPIKQLLNDLYRMHHGENDLLQQA
jgi:A/G-specific adenine glycosylase